MEPLLINSQNASFSFTASKNSSESFTQNKSTTFNECTIGAMFSDSENLERLLEEVWVYPNFLSPEECAQIVEELESNPDRVWAHSEHYDTESQITPYLQIISGSSHASKIHERLSNLVGPEFEPLPSNSINRLMTGQSLTPHWDSPGEEEQVPEGVDDPYATCHIVKYGTVVYLSDFTGGEIYYSRQNFEYKPKVGDLVIHSSMEPYEHGVREVLSGVRYVYSTFLIQRGRVELPKFQSQGEVE